MTAPPQALQFVGSLIAILVLAWLVKRLGLGKNPRLNDDAQARAAAAEASDGFEAQEIARDADGRGALLRDGQGRIMLLKPHGVHFAGRILTASASADCTAETISVDTGERRYGTIELQVDDPASWVEAINRLNKSGNA